MVPRPGDAKDDEDWEDDSGRDFQTGPAGTTTVNRSHPAVETVGDYTEFSNSESAAAAADETAVFQSSGPAPGEKRAAADVTTASDNTPPVEPSTVAEPPVEDHLGESGAPDPTEETTEGIELPPPETTATADDSFGDFDGLDAATITPVEETIPEKATSDEPPAADTANFAAVEDPVVETVDNSESFGDFGGVTEVVEANPENTVMPAAVETVDNSESFGDFDTATSVTGVADDAQAVPAEETVEMNPAAAVDMNSVTTGESIPETKEKSSDEVDLLGDFAASGAPEGSGSIPNTASRGGDVDPFGNFDSAGPASMGRGGVTNGDSSFTKDTTPVPTVDHDEDDFGDFGAVETSLPTQDEVSKPDENDEFGDFGAVDAETHVISNAKDSETEERNTESQNTAGRSVDDNDDFGAAKSIPDANDDSFGDFGTADPITETQTSGPDDDFEDFGEAAPNAAPAETSDALVSENDGDFGGFDAAKPETTDEDDFGVAEPAQKPVDNDHDDLGGFGAAESAQEPVGDDDDDDGFGDFGAAEPVAKVGAEQVDGDDDFGDFGAAEPTARADPGSEKQSGVENDDEDDDFGDFNDVDEGAHAQAVSTPAPAAAATSVASSDPVLQPVDAAMHRMFQKPSTQVPDDPDNDSTAAPVDALSVKELMESFQESGSQTKQTDELPAFWDLLQQSGLLRKGEPQIITTGTPPYGLQYPLHGFTSLYETKAPPEQRRASVPPVLGVRLQRRQSESQKPQSATVSDIKDESPAAPAPTHQSPAPSPAASPSALENSNGTVVKLPPKTSAGEDPARAETFLKKIPDLSFMLSSKLTLPA